MFFMIFPKIFHNVFGKHLISIDIPPQLKKRLNTYSLKVKEKLWLFITVRSLTLLKKIHKIPSFLCLVIFRLMLHRGKAHNGDIPEM